MVFQIYAYYDPRIDGYSQPFCAQLNDTQIIEQLTRMAKLGKLGSVSGCVVYWLGTFDDATGALDVKPAKAVLDVAKLEAQVALIQKSLEAKKDGE